MTLENVSQRWNHRRASYRPNGEPIQTSQYEVAPIEEKVAKAFVLAHHYSASYPAARRRMGLFHRSELVGVAVFSHPSNDKALDVFGAKAKTSVELGRFVLTDNVPSNGETWFLGRCFELLRPDFSGVLSFSDPTPRTSLSGEVIFPGHIGTIYQAHNASYLGRSTARTLRLLEDGTVFSDRTLQKIRARERGWEYAVELLVARGAEAPTGDLREWLAHWLPRMTRTLRHPGNHRYCWELAPRRKWSLPASLPYPKKQLASALLDISTLPFVPAQAQLSLAGL